MEGKRDSFFISDKKKKNSVKGQQPETLNKDKIQENNRHKHKRQENFNENREGLENEDVNEKVKKPFDKKTYRLKKYSKKYKLDQWEEQRKKKLLRNYYKEIKNDPIAESYKPKNFDEDATDGGESVGRFVKHPDLIKQEIEEGNINNNIDQNTKKAPFWRAKEQYNKIKQEKVDKQIEIEKAKEERKQKLLEYKKKKQERFKKLSKKTKKGQPVMTGRLELLLEKIQKSK